MLKRPPDEPNFDPTEKVQPDRAREQKTQMKTTIGKVVHGPHAADRFRWLVARTLGQPKKDDCQ